MNDVPNSIPAVIRSPVTAFGHTSLPLALAKLQHPERPVVTIIPYHAGAGRIITATGVMNTIPPSAATRPEHPSGEQEGKEADHA